MDPERRESARRRGASAQKRWSDDEAIADALGVHAAAGPGGTVLDGAWRIARAGASLIVIAVVATAVGAFVSSATREKRYTASADLLLTSQDVLATPGTGPDPTRESATNEALLALPVIADRTAGLLAREGYAVTPAAVRAAVAIVATPNTDVIRVDATSPDPAVAARMANAYGRAFADFRVEVAQAQVADAIARTRAAQARLSTGEQGGPRSQALAERLARLEDAHVAPSSGARLVQPATPPAAPTSPRPVRAAVLGAFAGAVLGFGLAALRDRRRASRGP